MNRFSANLVDLKDSFVLKKLDHIISFNQSDLITLQKSKGFKNKLV
jgi:hypothetical protein